MQAALRASSCSNACGGLQLPLFAWDHSVTNGYTRDYTRHSAELPHVRRNHGVASASRTVIKSTLDGYSGKALRLQLFLAVANYYIIKYVEPQFQTFMPFS